MIARDSLFSAIDTATPARLLCAAAPAGYGKSILLAQLYGRLLQVGVATAWLTLDQADNDLSRFLGFLGRALASAGVETGNIERYSGSDRTLQILDALAAARHRFTLFIDECEAINSSAVLACLRQLIEHLPPGGQVVLATRTVADMGLSRWRGRGEVVELGVEELRFSEDEAHQLVESVCAARFSQGDLQALHQATEGWPVALWLAAQVLRNAPDRKHMAGSFSGSTQVISDYLSEEVFAAQTQSVQAFLIRCSVLPYLIVEACNAVCGIDHSEQILVSLANANLFISPIAGQPQCYRLHRLFADFLQTQLERRLPGERQRLQARAAHWYLDEGRVVPAIELGIAADDLEFALPLLEQHSERLLGEGRSRLVAGLLDSVPEAALEPWPQLRTAHLWAVAFTRSATEAMELLQRREHASPFGDATALRPMLQVILDRHDGALEEARQLLEIFPASPSFPRAILQVSLAYELLVHRAPDEARDIIDQGRIAGLVDYNRFSSMFAQSVEVVIHLFAGHLRTALVQLQTTLREVGAGSTIIGILLAEALYETGQLEESVRLLDTYLPAMAEQGIPDHLIVGYRTRARIHFLHGDIDAALQALTKLEHLGYHNDNQRLVASARLERANLALRRGQYEAAGEFLARARACSGWQNTNSLWLFANDIETPDLVQLRLALHQGAAHDLQPELRRLLSKAEQGQQTRRAMKLRLLLACAELQQGHRARALRRFEQLLDHARTEGYRRLLLDEKAILQPLLQSAARETGGAADCEQLLEVLCRDPGSNRPPPAPTPKVEGLQEHPTDRELEVLALLSEGLSNQEISERMFISVSTVRAHLRNINGKLAASSRTQAVAIARKHGLLN
ncbi:hypothetical protein FV139_05445 [Parahaliea maris]|uniref:HTH luxR-type domain-containing protein n=1 Tax=Parahaliea maris TaxID=2716870 RepID=A0A5C9A7Z1_9GAMM|nr:LuxR C-terminal-related transcriptional regulator [Parahaliea maris]TXS95341.1 hypothetical protein FV139_05445 [Parahaliea maris]